jgi:prephenate dehydrogenase
VASAQQADQLVNRLLAGSYSQAAGEAMLTRLASEIANLERAIQLLQRREAQ